jgi:geranylgeranyl pyrophosphate synthase
VNGTAAHAGKRVRKDEARGKLTYPGFLGSEESRRRAEDLCRHARRSVAGLGSGGDRLAALAQSILQRDR